MNRNVTYHHLEETDSTNNYVRQFNTPEEDQAILVATEFQTAGRGQKGNSWESEPGANLLFSILIHPAFIPASHQFCISEAISLAVVKAAAELSAEEHRSSFAIKWPNDIYWNKKKIAGILIENELKGSGIERCVIGVGLDVNQKEFVSNAPNPASLYNINGKETDKEVLLELLMDKFMDYYQKIRECGADCLHEEYMSMLFRRTGMHRYKDENGEFMARISQVEQSGRIILTTQEGEDRRYEFKEVSIIL